MNVKTTRFGELDVPESDVIHFPDGILGFEDTVRYVILNDPGIEPLRWLQCLDIPDLAFVIIDPLKFRAEYSVDLSDSDVESLDLNTPEEAMIYSIVVIPKGNPEQMTANLQGPVVINAAKMVAKQVISTNSRHKTKHYILQEMKAMMACKQKVQEKKADVKLNRKQASAKKEMGRMP
jgi:flagellar assembly factor FliW